MTTKQHRDLFLGASGTIAALIGYSVIFLLPSFLEAAAVQFNLNNQQIGWLGSSETGGLAISTLLCALFINKLDIKKIAVLGIVIALIANVLSNFCTAVEGLLWSRLVAGLGEGLLVTAGMTALAKTANPDRWFAIYTGAAVVLQAAGLFLLPSVIQQWQLFGVLLCFIILLIWALFFIRHLPNKTDVIRENSLNSLETSNAKLSRNLVFGVFAILSFYISIGAVWTYIAGIGTAAGFSFEWVSTALSISMIGGFIGAVLLALMGRMATGSVILIVSGLIMLLCLYFLDIDFNKSQYTWTLIIYSVVWSVIASRLFSLIATADKSGRFITASQPMLNIGFALGPLMASGLIVKFSYSGVLALAAVSLLVSILCIIPLARTSKSLEL